MQQLHDVRRARQSAGQRAESLGIIRRRLECRGGAGTGRDAACGDIVDAVGDRHARPVGGRQAGVKAEPDVGGVQVDRQIEQCPAVAGCFGDVGAVLALQRHGGHARADLHAIDERPERQPGGQFQVAARLQKGVDRRGDGATERVSQHDDRLQRAEVIHRVMDAADRVAADGVARHPDDEQVVDRAPEDQFDRHTRAEYLSTIPNGRGSGRRPRTAPMPKSPSITSARSALCPSAAAVANRALPSASQASASRPSRGRGGFSSAAWR